MKYNVRVTETVVSRIEIEAETAQEAERIAGNEYAKNVALATLEADLCDVVCKVIESRTN